MAKYEGHCMLCKEEREIKNPKAVELPDGMWIAVGACIKCGTKTEKMVGKTKPADL